MLEEQRFRRLCIVGSYNRSAPFGSFQGSHKILRVGTSITDQIAGDIPGLKLRQLIAIPSLGLREVVGTAGMLERRVSWAHSTEMVDPRPHGRSGELVCTVGSSLVDPLNCARFVEAVHASGSAGICLGLGEVHTQAPADLASACRQIGVPLVTIAHGVPFLAINDVLLEERIGARTSTNTRDGAVIARLLECLRADMDIAGMLAIASEELGGEFSYSSAGGSAVHAVEPETARDGVVEVQLSDNESLLWMGADPVGDSDLLAQIGRIVQIAKRERAVSAGERRQRVGQLFALVADGFAHRAALAPEIEEAGLMGSDFTVSAWPASTADLLAAHLPQALVAATPDAVFVLAADASVVHDTATNLRLVCGYSSPVTASEITRGIAEARATLMLAQSRGRVTGPESLTTLTALLEQQSRGRLIPFVDQLIQPLLSREVRGGSDLLDTLRSFLANNCSLQATADAAFLHVNTVRHRLGRVCQVVGRDPLDQSDQIDFTIALWAYDRSPDRLERSEPMPIQRSRGQLHSRQH